MQEKKIWYSEQHIMMNIDAPGDQLNNKQYFCEIYTSQKGPVLTFLVQVCSTKFYSIALDLDSQEWMLLMKKDGEDLFERLVEKLAKVYDII